MGRCVRTGHYTDPDHNAFRVACVGSNNTGEVTAIIEALLHAHQHESQHVYIHTDSLWAKNVITGNWRAKRNKELVHFAKRLTKLKPLQVHFHWVKAHKGNEGSERADRLANQGKTHNNTWAPLHSNRTPRWKIPL